MNEEFIIKKSGQILVETMVALSMSVIALLGILSLLSSSLAINRIVSDNYVATYLAAEGIEVVKNIIDTNIANDYPYNQGLTGCDNANGCAFQYDSTEKMQSNSNTKLRFNDGIYSYNISGIQTRFSRKVQIYPVTSDVGTPGLRVVSIVSWVARGGVDRDVVLEDIFYNWKGQ